MCSFLLLFPLPKDMHSGKSCSCLHSGDFCLCCLLRVSQFHDLHSGLWSISSLLLCMGLDNNPVSFSCMKLSSFANTSYSRGCHCPIVCPWLLYCILIDHICLGFYLGSLVCSIGLWFSSCTSTKLS